MFNLCECMRGDLGKKKQLKVVTSEFWTWRKYI